jgi:hypothetical protein
MARISGNVCLAAILCLAACSGQDLSAPEPASSPTPQRMGATPSPDAKSTLENGMPRNGDPIGHYLHANKEALGLQTFQNAYKLERAVWKYAADNGGVVPATLGDRNLAGKTLFDYLPGKRYLINPFTRVRSEPGYGLAAFPGEVSYLEIIDSMGYLIGFTISAAGAHTNQYLQFDRYMEGQAP